MLLPLLLSNLAAEVVDVDVDADGDVDVDVAATRVARYHHRPTTPLGTA